MTRVSLSWLNLKPNMDLNGDKENLSLYLKRLRKIFPEYNHIPNTIFEQWIMGLHDDGFTINNYAWIDFTKVEFELLEWSNSNFKQLRVIKEFENYVSAKESFNDIRDFGCSKEAEQNWYKKGTWLTPPIIIETNSFEEIPKWSEIKGDFQLVEGHTRLGYLKSLIKQNKERGIKLATKHLVYVMRKKKIFSSPALLQENDYKPLSDEEINKAKNFRKSLSKEELKKLDDLLDDY